MIGGIYTLAWDYLANEMADNTHIIGFLLQNLKYSEVHIKCREQKTIFENSSIGSDCNFC